MTLSNIETIETALTPAEFAQGLEDAKTKAQALTAIVEQQKLFTQIGQGKHLRVEAWQTIGMGYGLTAAVDHTEILYDPQGTEVGAKAKVVVYDRQGVIRGGAEAYCMCDEGDWGNRNTNQRISMAGTRATSKALRLLLSWVVVLAGYEPTPAEEMTRDIPAKEDLGTCEQHGVAYFKTGNMRSPAHKLDRGGWCNAPTEANKAPESAPVAAETVPSQDLDDALVEANMTFENFELKVLRCTWDTFIKVKGASSDVAITKLNIYLEQQQEAG